MAQAKKNQLYRTFVRGLCTEASPLTYPPDTSFDELNTVPTRKGNRTRRFGINYNPDNTASMTVASTDAQSEFVWRAAASDIANTFLVVQNGNRLYFYDRSSSAFADNLESFTVSLDSYCRPGVSSVRTVPCHFASGKGFLFVVNKDMEPIVITYDPDSNDITINKITIQGRDFEGLDDGLANDAEPATLTTSHFYNLLNQGWISPGEG